MNAKDFLKQLRKLDMMIKNKMIEQAQMKAMAYGISSPGAPDTGVRVQSSGSQRRQEDVICKYVDMEAEIDRRIDALVDARMEVIRVIEQLNAEEYDLLHKVYVQYYTLGEVAEIDDKSYSYCTTLHGRALKSVQAILDKGIE